MTSQQELRKKLNVLSKSLLLIVIFLSSMNIVGWTFNIETFKRLTNLSVAMNPLAAILFLLGCIAFGLIRKPTYSKRRQLIAFAIACIMIIVGIYKVISYIIDVPFFLDQLIYSRQLFEPNTRSKSQLDPICVFALIHIGLTIILIDKRFKFAEVFMFMNTILGLLCLYGYAYDTPFLTGIAQLFPVPILSAFCILFFNLAALFSRPYQGGMQKLVSESPFEVIAMRLIALFIPLFVGWLKLFGEDQKWYSKEFGTAIFGVFSYGISMFFLQRKSSISYQLRSIKAKKNKKIRKAARKFNDVINNSPSIIFILNKEGKVKNINNQGAKFLGINKKDIIGKKAEEIIDNKTLLEEIEEKLEIFETKETQSKEIPLEFEGKRYIYLNQAFPLINENDKVYGVCSINTDVTELKNKEKELNKKNIWLDNIINNMAEGVIVADNEGNFLLYNNAAEEILGKKIKKAPREEVSTIFNFYHPENDKLLPKEELPLTRALKGEEVDNIEFLSKNPDWDKPKLIRASARPLRNGDIDQAVVVFRDITQEKK